MTAAERTEMILLGIMLESVDCQAEALDRLTIEDFTTIGTRKLYDSFCTIHRETGTHVDMAAIVAGLPNDLFHALIGVTDAADADARSTAGYRRLIQAVADNSDRMWAKKGLEGMAKHMSELTPADLSSELRQISDGIAVRRARPDSEDYGNLLMAAFNAATSRRAKDDRITFNIPPLDAILGDVVPGNIVTIAARTGVGKSSIAIAPAMLTAQTRQVVYVSTEMTRHELAIRNLAHVTDVAQDRIKAMDLSPAQLNTVTQALANARTLRIRMVDGVNTVTGIQSVIDEMERKGTPCRLLIVDHIGHIKPGAGYKNQNEYADIKESCVRLKHMAMTKGLVIVMIAQLSRKVDEYDEPSLGDLKDCGEIEQISDKVVFMWREKNDLRLRHLKCAKARGGEGDGKCDLLFYGSTMRFYGLRGD